MKIGIFFRSSLKFPSGIKQERAIIPNKGTLDVTSPVKSDVEPPWEKPPKKRLLHNSYSSSKISFISLEISFIPGTSEDGIVSIRLNHEGIPRKDMPPIFR